MLHGFEEWSHIDLIKYFDEWWNEVCQTKPPFSYPCTSHCLLLTGQDHYLCSGECTMAEEFMLELQLSTDIKVCLHDVCLSVNREWNLVSKHDKWLAMFEWPFDDPKNLYGKWNYQPTPAHIVDVLRLSVNVFSIKRENYGRIGSYAYCSCNMGLYKLRWTGRC